MSVSGPRWSRRDLLGASASLALGLSLESPGAAADAAATPEEAPQQRRSGASRPNIILFVPDEMRADTGGGADEARPARCGGARSFRDARARGAVRDAPRSLKTLDH
ncbi:MAG: hypothetical protein WAN26_01920 [Steroidobacteraceae bacterium]